MGEGGSEEKETSEKEEAQHRAVLEETDGPGVRYLYVLRMSGGRKNLDDV